MLIIIEFYISIRRLNFSKILISKLIDIFHRWGINFIACLSFHAKNDDQFLTQTPSLPEAPSTRPNSLYKKPIFHRSTVNSYFNANDGDRHFLNQVIDFQCHSYFIANRHSVNRDSTPSSISCPTGREFKKVSQALQLGDGLWEQTITYPFDRCNREDDLSHRLGLLRRAKPLSFHQHPFFIDDLLHGRSEQVTDQVTEQVRPPQILHPIGGESQSTSSAHHISTENSYFNANDGNGHFYSQVIDFQYYSYFIANRSYPQRVSIIHPTSGESQSTSSANRTFLEVLFEGQQIKEMVPQSETQTNLLNSINDNRHKCLDHNSLLLNSASDIMESERKQGSSSSLPEKIPLICQAGSAEAFVGSTATGRE